NSVLCGMAIQDRLARRNAEVPEQDRIAVRVAISLGDVRLERRDVFGDPVNVAARVEGETPAGEVWITEAVYLSMNKSEVPAEEIGARALKGIAQPVMLYRVPRLDGALPFGGLALARADQRGLLSGIHRWRAALAAGLGLGELLPLIRAGLPRAIPLVLAGAVLVAAATGILIHRRSDPIARAERALNAGMADQALRDLAGAEDSADADLLRGRALHALKRGDEGVVYYRSAAAKDAHLLTRPEVLEDLAQDLSGPRSAEAAGLLEKAGDASVDVLAEAARDEKNHRRRWAAIEVLRKVKHEEKVDIVAAYIADLKSRDCAKAQAAARRLGEIGDRRAIEPLREAASQRRLAFFDTCEAPAARAALRKLEKP
ncbi:MAG TPA: adenylate/guanylate cyclase domain-containing protein, partial [Myxococcaceae bacterium]|nr:adenylate/guanylate cyclase domain-containing protein [Myxococcaceae bacterium]